MAIWNAKARKIRTRTEINEKQKTNCLNCIYNPMSDAEYAAARMTDKVDFICGHNGMFRIKDINNGNNCYNHIRASLPEL